MFKKTAVNAAVIGFAQAVSLAIILLLAGVLDAEDFGTLSIQLSAAAVISIISTLQFERVYVRMKSRAFKGYVAFHIRSLLIVSVFILAASIFFPLGPSAAALAFSMGFAQIALYAAAREGKFRQIWLMKFVQAFGLLLLTALVYSFGRANMFWLAFMGSYLSAGLFVLDGPTCKALTSNCFRNDIRRLRYSFRIASLAFISLLSGSFTREFPVLLSGAMGQPETAGSVGLVMRLASAPIGLLARSAAAVVANYVASARLDFTAVKMLSFIPIIGSAYIFVLGMATPHVPALSKYGQFEFYLFLLAPMFVLRAYVGLLGSALVYFRIQRYDALYNFSIAIGAAFFGAAVMFLEVNFFWLLLFTSISTSAACVLLLFKLIRKLRR